MLRLVVSQVREEEEIAVAVLKFQLGRGDVVVVEIQVRKEEALDVALALYAVTDRGLSCITVGHIL